MKPRSLILMRHGKAEKAGPSDHERLLTEKGKEQSIEVGKSLKKAFGHLDRAIASDAARTRQTVAQVCFEVPILQTLLEPKLYSIDSQREFYAAVAPHLSHSENSLLIVGHNPVISALASYYTGQHFDLGTGEYVIVSLDATDWLTALEFGGCWSLKYPR